LADGFYAARPESTNAGRNKPETRCVVIMQDGKLYQNRLQAGQRARRRNQSPKRPLWITQ
jgi:hypothetical protein